MLTFFLLPETTGLDMAEADRFYLYLTSGEVERYMGEAGEFGRFLDRSIEAGNDEPTNQPTTHRSRLAQKSQSTRATSRPSSAGAGTAATTTRPRTRTSGACRRSRRRSARERALLCIYFCVSTDGYLLMDVNGY